ncbi:hypothetical protein [Neptuniibacter sp.]|nr:hypothetical protein [Neptuniibacter sp.]MCP4598263.1 hypothetical protein [Neptuniibacter sp.]
MEIVEITMYGTKPRWCKTDYKCTKYGWLKDIQIVAKQGDENHHYIIG